VAMSLEKAESRRWMRVSDVRHASDALI